MAQCAGEDSAVASRCQFAGIRLIHLQMHLLLFATCQLWCMLHVLGCPRRAAGSAEWPIAQLQPLVALEGGLQAQQQICIRIWGCAVLWPWQRCAKSARQAVIRTWLEDACTNKEVSIDVRTVIREINENEHLLISEIRLNIRKLGKKPKRAIFLETQKKIHTVIETKTLPKWAACRQLFCANQSKFEKSTTGECNSELQHFTYLCVQWFCSIVAWFQQQQTKPSCTSCMFKSNQSVQKRRNKSIWTPKNEVYICTTIEIISCWSLDLYSSAAMLCLIFTHSTYRRKMETHEEKKSTSVLYGKGSTSVNTFLWTGSRGKKGCNSFSLPFCKHY